MEKKHSRRIVGALVIVALVIILMPIMYNKDDQTIRTSAKSYATFPTADVNEPVQDVAMTAESQPAPVSAAPVLAENTAPTVAPSQPEHAPTVAPKVVAAANISDVFEKSIKHEVDTIFHPQKSKISVAKVQQPLNNTLASNHAFVVQLGSFKHKFNATRLTDHLRAKGFKAFTVHMAKNDQTRVYVGPELQKLSAKQLAHNLEKDFRIHGVVLLYKPMDA